MNEDIDTNHTKHADVTELISKHNMKIRLDIKQEQADVEEFSTDCKGSCLNIKEATDISSYKVGYVNEYSKQVKSEVGFENNHRGRDLKQETVERNFKQNDVKQVDVFVEDNKEEVELDDSKDFKIDILEHNHSNNVLNTEVIINSSLGKIDLTCEHSVRVKSGVSYDSNHGEISMKQEVVEDDNVFEGRCNTVGCERNDCFQYNFGQNESMIEYDLKTLVENGHSKKVEQFQCNYKTNYEPGLVSHFKAEHHEASEIYQCQFCLYRSNNESDLKKHLYYKNNETSNWYQCNLCNFKTKFKHHLVRHCEWKHNIYRCKRCGLKCETKCSLKEHVNRKQCVANPEQYECQFCESKFKSKDSLREHIRHKHKENVSWHQCNVLTINQHINKV